MPYTKHINQRNQMIDFCIIEVLWDDAIKVQISPAEQARLDRIELQNKSADKLQEDWDNRWSVA